MDVWLHSVESIALLWVVSLVGLATLGLGFRMMGSKRRGSRVGGLTARRLSLRKIVRVETGASYSLGYVLSMPLYAMFLIMIVQCTLLLMAKIGTVYASYAAARAAAVWSSARSPQSTAPGSRMEAKARQAAILAMVPFASGAKEHLSSAASGGANLVGPYQVAAREFGAAKGISDAYLSRKVRNAAGGIRGLDVTRRDDGSGGLVEVTLTYDAPFLIPWMGRVFGAKSSGGHYVHSIESSAILPNEDPRDGGHDIGIEYLSE